MKKTQLERGVLEKKRRFLARELKSKPHNLTNRMNLAHVLWLLGKRKQSLVEYRRTAQFAMKLGDSARALAACRALLRLDHESPETRLLLAKLFASNPEALPQRIATPVTEQQAGAIVRQLEEPPESDVIDLSEDVELLSMADSILDVTVPDGQGAISEPEEVEVPVGQDFGEGDNLLSLARKMPLFFNLDMESFIKLVKSMEVRRLPVDHVVIKEGDPAEGFYLIAQGRVRVTKRRADGQEVEVAMLGPGSFFGEFALFAETKRRASVTAVEKLELLEVSQEALAELMEDHPHIRTTLANFYRQRMVNSLIATSTLFSELSDDERESLAGRFVSEEYEPNHIILEEGTTPAGIYLIGRGEVEVVIQERRREHKVLARLREGEFLGIVALAKGTEVTASLKAATRTLIFRLPKSDFDSLCKGDRFAKALQRAAEVQTLLPDALLAGETSYSMSGVCDT